jgi:hypothetical protein
MMDTMYFISEDIGFHGSFPLRDPAVDLPLKADRDVPG